MINIVLIDRQDLESFELICELPLPSSVVGH